jgi:rhamnose transport system permease protein
MTVSDPVAEKKASANISEVRPRIPFLSRFLHWEWFLLGLILLVVIFFSRLTPFFLNLTNLFRSSSDYMEMGLMMLPMVLIITTGNVDLSVASTLGMTASFLGVLFMGGTDIWIAAAAALLLGALAGLLNGFLISRLKVPALVITLGTYAFYRGIAYVLLGDQAARGYPASFTYIGQGKLLGTPVPFSMLLFVLLAIVFGLLLHKTAFGRYLYAIGSNQDASLYSGVPVARIKMILFLLSGLMSALAGMVIAARFGSTRPDIGLGLELSVITATVLGGVDINGGKGTMIGAILALLLVGLMRFGMGLLNIQGQVQDTAIGVLLVMSILLPNLSRIGNAIRTRWDQRSLVLIILGLIILVLFGWFFFSSRAIVLAM